MGTRFAHRFDLTLEHVPTNNCLEGTKDQWFIFSVDYIRQYFRE